MNYFFATSVLDIFLDKCSSTLLNLAAVMAPLIRLQDHITAVLQLELSLGVCASQGGEAMVFETVSFLQSYFKQFTVSA